MADIISIRYDLYLHYLTCLGTLDNTFPLNNSCSSHIVSAI